MVSADFLRNIPIIRYLHLSTTTHTFLVFYSLDWMHVVYRIYIYSALPQINILQILFSRIHVEVQMTMHSYSREVFTIPK